MTAAHSRPTRDLLDAIGQAVATDQPLGAADALVFDLASAAPRHRPALPPVDGTTPIQHVLPRPGSNAEVATALRDIADLLEAPELPLAARYVHHRVVHLWHCADLAEARRIGMYARLFGALVRERPSPDAGVLVVEMVFGPLVLQALTPLAGLEDTGG